jgi:hypothetical protein
LHGVAASHSASRVRATRRLHETIRYVDVSTVSRETLEIISAVV